MGSIVDGISSLFGGGSNQRNQKNDQNSSGSALGDAYGTVGKAGGQFANQGGYLSGGSAGALGMQGGTLQNQNNQATQENGLANTAANTYNQNYGNAISAMLGADGFTPYGGAAGGEMQPGGGRGMRPGGGAGGMGGGMSYNPNFNPYAATGDSLISQYSDKVAPGYQNAVNAAQHDDLSRGITGANTMGPAQDQQIRQAQASDVANFGRNLGVQAQQEKYNRLGNAISMINGAGQTAMNGYQNAGNTYGNVAQGYGSQSSGYGNLANGFGNTGNNYLNQARGYGDVSTGYQNGANSYGNAGQQQQQNLYSLAGLFGA